MKKLAALMVLGLAALALAGGCNGGNEVTGVNGGGGTNTVRPPTPVQTPHPRPTPSPCNQNPIDCN